MSILLPDEKILSRSFSALLDRVTNQGEMNKSEIDFEKLPNLLHLVELASSLMAMVDEVFGRYLLTQPRFMILVCLHTAVGEAMSPAKLADALGVRRATMTGLLDGLEKGGWIRREQDTEDRRKVIVSISPEGRMRLEAILPTHVQTVIALSKGISREEITTLVALFEKFVRHAQTIDLKSRIPSGTTTDGSRGSDS